MHEIFTQTARQSARKKGIVNHPKRKASQSVFALSLLSAALLATSSPATAQYVDPGLIGNKASWETAEYKKDWGVAAMKASSAYALGFYGQGVKVGVMDSGALLFSHPDLNSERFHAVAASGQYGTTGVRYPQVAPPGDQNPYTAGQAFDITGQWIQDVNDGHGTHVTGTVGANRDGIGMHGVAWGADVYVGNTGATDGNNYGPYQDYQFFYTGWKAMVDAGAQVINNSWGTNVRVVDPRANPLTDPPILGSDGGNITVMLPADTTAQTEYEYFYFKKMYGNAPSFVDAAFDAVKGTNTVQVFTTGNRDFANPYHRALYPYFHPEAEKHWIAVGGIREDTANPGRFLLEKTFNEAGNAKWWTVVAPGRLINSTTVDLATGAPGYKNSSGTSMSAPHVTGAMGVLLSRYQDMNAIQVRDVMFTTASNKNLDGTALADWTALDGTPDIRFGWGIPDLEKGMYGPGQLLGRFEYNMASTPLDVWTNNISQTGLDARKVEDEQWLNDYRTNGIAAGGGYELGDTNFVVDDGNSDATDHVINLADAQQWRGEYYAKRAAAIQGRLEAGLYEGTLVKQGAGALVMTGDNTYRGGATVEGGSLYGFTESFGTGTVVVNGGALGVISSYNDAFTQKGSLTSTEIRKANIEVGNGGTYAVIANENVNVGALTFKDGSKITVGAVDESFLLNAYNSGTAVAGSVTATTLTDFNKAALPDYAFFNTSLTASGNTITGNLSRNNGVTFSSYAMNRNGRAIAQAVDTSRSGALYDALVPATIGEVRATYSSLGSDMYLNANNASIMNAMSTSRVVKDQAMGVGGGRTAAIGGSGDGGSNISGLEPGSARIWITGIGNWSNVDYGQSDMDVDFYTALLGAELNVTANNKAGLFVGAGSTKYKGGTYGKIDSDDLHFGLYGIYNAADTASITYGLVHTRQDRDAHRTLSAGSQVGSNSVSNDARITQLFAEAAYTGWRTDAYAVEPYAGINWMRVKSDGFSEKVGSMQFDTASSKQTLQVGTIGVRGSIPFKLGGVNMAATGGVSGMHFFGDSTPEARMYLANTGVAKIKGGKLDNLLGVSFGVEAQIKNESKVELSYQGAYNGDIKSHGVKAKILINF